MTYSNIWVHTLFKSMKIINFVIKDTELFPNYVQTPVNDWFILCEKSYTYKEDYSNDFFTKVAPLKSHSFSRYVSPA